MWSRSQTASRRSISPAWFSTKASTSRSLIFVCVGPTYVINIRHSGVRKGGELLTEWNRLQFRLVGAIFIAFATYLLYFLLFKT